MWPIWATFISKERREEIMSKDVQIGRNILTEDDLKFTVTYEGEVFTLRYPTPFEVSQIEADIVRRLGGYPRSSFAQEHLAMIEATAYANELVIRDESPAWFKSAWTCYDPDCIKELFRGYLAFSGEFQDRLRNNGFENGSKRGKS